MNRRDSVFQKIERRTLGGYNPERDYPPPKEHRRKSTLLWIGASIFISFWMFCLGILVGRGWAPVQFDIESLQQELSNLKKAAIDRSLRQYETDAKNAESRAGLKFYEVLKGSKDTPPPPVLPDSKTKSVSKSATTSLKNEPSAKISTSPVAVAPSTVPTQKPAAPSAITIQKPAPTVVSENAPIMAPPGGQKLPVVPEKPVKEEPTAGNWTIQVLSVKDSAEADRILARLRQQGYPATKLSSDIPGKGVWYRLRVGPYKRREEVDMTVAKLQKAGFSPMTLKTGVAKESP